MGNPGLRMLCALFCFTLLYQAIFAGTISVTASVWAQTAQTGVMPPRFDSGLVDDVAANVRKIGELDFQSSSERDNHIVFLQYLSTSFNVNIHLVAENEEEEKEKDITTPETKNTDWLYDPRRRGPHIDRGVNCRVECRMVDDPYSTEPGKMKEVCVTICD